MLLIGSYQSFQLIPMRMGSRRVGLWHHHQYYSYYPVKLLIAKIE